MYSREYLQRSSGEEQPVLRRELAYRHAEQRRLILEPVQYGAHDVTRHDMTWHDNKPHKRHTPGAMEMANLRSKAGKAERVMCASSGGHRSTQSAGSSK